jgi:hypothetical protein
MQSMLTHSSPPSDDEVAAALAAVQCLLAEEQAPPVEQAGMRPWQAAAMLESRGLLASRSSKSAEWPSAERANRALRWSKGIVGL